IPGAWLGMGCKAQFAANSRSYWQKLQRRRPPKPGDRGPRGINPRFPRALAKRLQARRMFHVGFRSDREDASAFIMSFFLGKL
ncbi:MAG: hypothetical protein Q7T46_07845, partial [Polaromonas sp.]|nr:hypothetical protein [Polaromonas sp.]